MGMDSHIEITQPSPDITQLSGEGGGEDRGRWDRGGGGGGGGAAGVTVEWAGMGGGGRGGGATRRCEKAEFEASRGGRA